MSVCVFIAADNPLPEVRPSQEYPLYIDLDTDTVYDGDADDNFFLLPFGEADVYCEKKYGVCLEMYRCTDGRAKRIIRYISNALLREESVELWKVWLLGYWEHDDRPYIHRRTVRIDELTAADIEALYQADNWNNRDRDRPSFYCIEVIR